MTHVFKKVELGVDEKGDLQVSTSDGRKWKDLSSYTSRISSLLDIPGCQLLFDASQIDGLNDGDKVSLWSDLSPNGFDAVQADEDIQPVFKTNIQNGLPGVRFVGDVTTDDFSDSQFLNLEAPALSTLFRGWSGVTIVGVRGPSTVEAPIIGLSSFGAYNSGFTQLVALSFGGKFPDDNVDGRQIAPPSFSVQTALNESSYGQVGGVGDVADGPLVPLRPNLPGGIIVMGSYDSGGSYLIESSPPFPQQWIIDPDLDVGPLSDDACDWIALGGFDSAAGLHSGFGGDICLEAVFDHALNALERRLVFELLADKWNV